LAALAFILSALVELAIKPSEAVMPVQGEAQLRIFNTFNCPLVLNSQDPNVIINDFEVSPLRAFERLHIAAQGNKMFDLTVKPGTGCVGLSDTTVTVEYKGNTVSMIF
jgi:hypothetical protein